MLLPVLIAALLIQQPPSAQSSQNSSSAQAPQQPVPPISEHVEVVATRLPESPERVPVAVEVLSGEELRNRGITNLADALALAAGVDIAPGGDNGPAASVPEFWGLKEFDAFLLVVDGVPWGGAFNPSLTTLSLYDVDRIEVMRGPAPVTYGATSFVGVIHVVHNGASSPDLATARLGSFGSGGASLAATVPFLSGWQSRLTVDFDRQGFEDDRTSYRRGHALWRNMRGDTTRRIWFNVDAIWMDQDPQSPRVRVGQDLSPLVPVDSNQNPAGAFLDENRFTGMFGFDRPAGRAAWTTTASISASAQKQFRGFLGALTNTPDNANGLRENIDQLDFYADSHFAWRLHDAFTLVLGGDYLHGNADAEGQTFTYTAVVDGSTAPAVTEPADLPLGMNDRRDFLGGYGLVEWDPRPRVRVSGGLRLNGTVEEREGEADAAPKPAGQPDAVQQTNVRPSGSLGAIWTTWEHGAEAVRLFANYRNTFKPAAIDFGLGEADTGEEDALLKPETSQSIEGGLKSRLGGGLVELEADAFLMDFANLVISQSVNGLPGLTNAGTQRFKGFETSANWWLPRNLTLRGTYSFHDARFKDYLTEFDGVPTQLGGNRIEMSARHLFSTGIICAPSNGILALMEVRYVGSRYLNKRNTALAPGYTTLALGAGYRTHGWELRVDARNVTDTRPPVAESELGDSQYYILPSRRIDLSFTKRF
jgi:iron complex outermembrane receptor protein